MDSPAPRPIVDEFTLAKGDPTDVQDGSRRDYLEDAAAFLRVDRGHDPAEPWSLDALRDRQIAEIAAISEWINFHSLWLEVAVVGDLRLGGTEHDIEWLGEPPTWVRRVSKPTDETRCIGYGFTAGNSPCLHLRPACLSDYLMRLVLLSEVFPSVAYQLEGWIRLPRRIEVVTKQRLIPGRLLSDLAADIGKKEMQAQVDHWFRKRGFGKLYLTQQIGPSHAWYRPADNLAIFDAKPANLIEWDGHLFPIDVIPLQPEGALLRAILAAVE